MRATVASSKLKISHTSPLSTARFRVGITAPVHLNVG
jgi:hypothetical protein